MNHEIVSMLLSWRLTYADSGQNMKEVAVVVVVALAILSYSNFRVTHAL